MMWEIITFITMGGLVVSWADAAKWRRRYEALREAVRVHNAAQGDPPSQGR